MGLFGGTNMRAGYRGGPDNVVIKGKGEGEGEGEGESIILPFKDPNLQL